MAKFRRDKVVAVYDADARKEYLTGFHKRKVARRQAAAEERAEMEKAARRDAVRKRREDERAQARAAATIETFTEAPELGAAPAETEYADEFTKRTFGADTVVVTTLLGAPGDEEDDEQAQSLRELASAAPRAPPRAPPAAPALRKQRGRSNPNPSRGGPKALTKRRHVNEQAKAREARRDGGGRGRGGRGRGGRGR